MADLSLDTTPTSPGYGDLLIVDGDLVLTRDADARGAHAVLQDILCRLRTFAGEWFLDNEIGVPYYQTVFIKNPDMAVVNGALKDEILGTPGVLSLDFYESREDRRFRRLTVSFHVTTVLGKVTYNGPLLGELAST